MTETALKVIHTIPGRLRMELPPFKRNSAVESALQDRVQAINGVDTARVNAIARSITVRYDQSAITEADLRQHLIDVVTELQPELVSNTLADSVEFSKEPEAVIQTALSGYTVIHLTGYEATQFAAIQEWLQQKVPWYAELMGRILIAAKGIFDFLIPTQVFQNIGEACESATADWPEEWQELQPIAQVKDYSALRQVDLQKCDQLAQHVIDSALVTSTAEGGITGLLDVFGEVVDDGLTLVLALKTIHNVGLCYGYAPQTQQEKAYAWAVFNAGVAQTADERQKALARLRSLREALNEAELQRDIVEESLEEDANALVVDSTLEQGLAQLTEETVGGLVPVLGIFLSVLADRNLIEQVGTAAQREFQLRWLVDNQRIGLVEEPVQTEVAAKPEDIQETEKTEETEETEETEGTLDDREVHPTDPSVQGDTAETQETEAPEPTETEAVTEADGTRNTENGNQTGTRPKQKKSFGET